MRRSVQSLFLAGVGDEDDGRLEATWKMLREHARELDYGRSARSIVVGAGCILGCLEAGKRSEIATRADTRVIVPTHHHYARGVASREPRQHVHDVDHRSLRMAAHLHHRRI